MNHIKLPIGQSLTSEEAMEYYSVKKQNRRNRKQKKERSGESKKEAERGRKATEREKETKRAGDKE